MAKYEDLLNEEEISQDELPSHILNRIDKYNALAAKEPKDEERLDELDELICDEIVIFIDADEDDEEEPEDEEEEDTEGADGKKEGNEPPAVTPQPGPDTSHYPTAQNPNPAPAQPARKKTLFEKLYHKEPKK